METSPRLTLRARDLDDMRVISAFLQDSLVPLGDVAYQAREKRFVMVANRFRWETRKAQAPSDDGSGEAAKVSAEGDAGFEYEAGPPPFERVNSGIRFDRVTNVRFRDIDLKDTDQILNLLALEAEPRAITMIFSGGGVIRLEVSRIVCHMEDLGEPWPTHWRPKHALDDAEGAR